MAELENDLVFDMGLYKASLPVRLRYSEIHFWLDTQDGKTRIGLTSYASRLLGEIFRLEWEVQLGQEVGDASPLGQVESTKATSELYAPFAGKLLAINAEFVKKPARIAKDPYTAWLLEFELREGMTLDVHAYHRFLTDGWEETQQMLKGQL